MIQTEHKINKCPFCKTLPAGRHNEAGPRFERAAGGKFTIRCKKVGFIGCDAHGPVDRRKSKVAKMWNQASQPEPMERKKDESKQETAE